MLLNKVTITGADDKIHPYDLVQISDDYPFVEWGILYSKTRQGTSRYPSEEWLSNFAFTLYYFNVELNLSAHYCGEYSKRVLVDQEFDLINDLSDFYQRVQLNNSFKQVIDTNVFNLLNAKLNKNIILQYNSNTESIIKRVTGLGIHSNCHFLYDASGGGGHKIEEINNPILHHYTGYAGGINPDNIEDILNRISEHDYKYNTWIDMESGIRTNDEFDIDKVIEVLEKSKKYVKI